MSTPLILHGYGYSVYTRAVRMVLVAKGVAYDYREVDPFEPDQPANIPHPFGRVPVLEQGSFRLYETQAILDYIEATYPDPSLISSDPQEAARVRQVMGITDSYVYNSLVRQVVSQAMFVPLDGAQTDASILADGMRLAPQVLGALEDIADEGKALTGHKLTLADCLLWPMLDYFCQVPVGAAAMAQYPALQRWADQMALLSAAQQTAPEMENYTP